VQINSEGAIELLIQLRQEARAWQRSGDVR
jgi:hypothetical protein